jgi:hypothetical protein
LTPNQHCNASDDSERIALSSPSLTSSPDPPRRRPVGSVNFLNRLSVKRMEEDYAGLF